MALAEAARRPESFSCVLGGGQDYSQNTEPLWVSRSHIALYCLHSQWGLLICKWTAFLSSSLQGGWREALFRGRRLAHSLQNVSCTARLLLFRTCAIGSECTCVVSLHEGGSHLADVSEAQRAACRRGCRSWLRARHVRGAGECPGTACDSPPSTSV